jgi:hypothetical protein
MKHVLAILLLLSPVLAWGQGAGSVAVVPTVADLANRVPSQLNPVVSLLGYRTNGDFGAPRTIRYIPDSTNAVDNGCTFATVTGVGRWEAPDCEGGHVNVRYFDARGDGETDDTAAFQAAFDAVPMPATNTFYEARGGAVFIPNGVYVVSAPLRMRPKSVEGSSRFGTVILNRGTTNDVFTAMTPSGTPPTGIWLYRVAHLSIHQAADVAPTAGAGIRVQSDDGVTASMVDVEDVFMHGLYRGFHGSALQGSSLKDVTVYAAREDGILWDVYQTMVHASGCWTYYCGQDGTGHGWHLQGPAYCTVTASGADSNYGWGWYIEPGSDQNPVGGTYAVGGEQNSKGGMFIKGARGGVYTPMLVTRAGNSPPADGIVLDHCLRVSLVGAFTQQHGSGAIGYPLRVTNAWAGYPSAVVVGSYLNSYNDGTNYHQVLGEVTSLVHEERGFLGLRTDGIPRRMLDLHDRTGAAGNSTGHELARLALHTADTNGNAYISLSPDGETTFHRIIANNLSTNTVFNYGTNGDTVFLGPSAPLSGDNGSFLFQLGATPVMSIKGGDTLGGVGIGTTRPNPAALLDIRSSTRGLLLPRWTSTEYTGGIYGSGQYTPPGLLSYDSTDRRVRVQTRNAADGLTNNQYTTLFGYVDRDLRLGTAHRQIGKIWPQSVHATDTNIGSVYIYFTAENVCGLEIEQNSLRAAPFQFGTFGDSILRNNYEGSAGAYGNLQIMAGTHAGVIVSNGTHRGSVSIRTNLFVTGDLVRSNGMTLTGSLDSKAATNHTHDASNTVSGQFESARLGSGTSDTDTFLRGGDTPTWDQLSADDIPNLPASRITSGTFDPARLGTGTATTNTFLQGDGSGGALWGTIPSVASPTNGIADAPADGIFYGRLNNAWTQPDISHLSGVSGWGLAWIDGTVADDVDALTTLGLLGGGPATIDSPATYAVRVGSGGTISTRHRLNLIASTGLSLSLSDDSINDESDVTVSIADRDWGDITSTSSGTTWNIDADAVGANEIASNAVGTSEIDDNAVTYAKIQNVTASRVLGRGAGSGDGDPEELTIGGGLAMTGTTIHTNPVVVAASKLVGRGSASGSGAAEEITIGPSLTMTGTTLDVSPGMAPQLLLVTTSETTDANQDTTWRDVTPTPRSGMSATIASGGLLTGHVLKVEVTGAMTTSTSGDFRPELRLLLDGATSDYAITWIMNEPYSSSPYAGATWTAEATIVIGASGSPATVRQRSRALYEAGETPGPGVSSYSSTGVATGSLYTGEDNVVKLEYRAMDADMTNFKVTSLIVTRL